MSTRVRVTIRSANADDAPSVAALHAASWRRHYRGAYSDDYLDSDLDAERLAVWTDRLCQPSDDRITFVAEGQGQMAGFVHAVFDADTAWGTLIDNLHVTLSSQRNGIGSRLLDAAARAVLQGEADGDIYLWVLEQNRAAQAFYRSRGGTFVSREPAMAPGGDPRNLHGQPCKFRVMWSDPTLLLLEE